MMPAARASGEKIVLGSLDTGEGAGEVGDRLVASTNDRSSASGGLWLLVPVLVFLGLHLHSLDYEFVWTDRPEVEQADTFVAKLRSFLA